MNISYQLLIFDNKEENNYIQFKTKPLNNKCFKKSIFKNKF